jgi:hypothetical protein
MPPAIQATVNFAVPHESNKSINSASPYHWNHFTNIFPSCRVDTRS